MTATISAKEDTIFVDTDAGETTAATRIFYDGDQQRALVFQRHHAATLLFDAGRMLAQARRHHDVEPGRDGGPDHWQEMRNDRPVLGDQIKKFAHRHSADRRDATL